MIRWFKKFLTIQLVGYLILAGGIAYAVDRVHQLDRQGLAHSEQKLAAQETRLHVQLVESCIRLNQVRASDNASHFADYQNITQQVGFTKASLRADYVALSKLSIAPKVLNRALKQSEEGLKTQENAIKLKSWTPLTNCSKAIATQGAYYPSPPPVLFVTKLPPKSALNFTNATSTSPKGSVL